ncbi:hypothetical protein M8J76_015018 [Diaphorina citri]|nr:hypothetical protein M8J75_003485 [Diaphorina citri]KAI5724076.1 hypothetical protein M8J76_015018 [Diaphorina citri]
MSEISGRTSSLKRKASQNLTFAAKRAKKTSCRKLISILQKNEEDRTPNEKQMILDSNDSIGVLKERLKKINKVKSRNEELEDEPEVLAAKCKKLAEAIQNAKHVVVYTGAGISTAAKIPDYRGTKGIWTLLQQGKDIGNHDLSLAEPTLTHMALYKLYRHGFVKHVVSQNCDDLHLRSGLPRSVLSEVHGNMSVEVCAHCDPVKYYWRVFDVTEHTARYAHQTARKCSCGEPLLDTIIHFGEKGVLLWPLNWDGANKNADRADLILCVLRKYGWLWGLDRPKKERPKLCIVNLQWTPKDDQATLKINGKCDVVFKQLMAHLNLDIPTYDKRRDPIFYHSSHLIRPEYHTVRKPMLDLPDEEYFSKYEDCETLLESFREMENYQNTTVFVKEEDGVKDEDGMKEEDGKEEAFDEDKAGGGRESCLKSEVEKDMGKPGRGRSERRLKSEIKEEVSDGNELVYSKASKIEVKEEEINRKIEVKEEETYSEIEIKDEVKEISKFEVKEEDVKESSIKESIDSKLTKETSIESRHVSLFSKCTVNLTDVISNKEDLAEIVKVFQLSKINNVENVQFTLKEDAEEMKESKPIAEKNDAPSENGAFSEDNPNENISKVQQSLETNSQINDNSTKDPSIFMETHLKETSNPPKNDTKVTIEPSQNLQNKINSTNNQPIQSSSEPGESLNPSTNVDSNIKNILKNFRKAKKSTSESTEKNIEAVERKHEVATCRDTGIESQSREEIDTTRVLLESPLEKAVSNSKSGKETTLISVNSANSEDVGVKNSLDIEDVRVKKAESSSSKPESLSTTSQSVPSLLSFSSSTTPSKSPTNASNAITSSKSPTNSITPSKSPSFSALVSSSTCLSKCECRCEMDLGSHASPMSETCSCKQTSKESPPLLVKSDKGPFTGGISQGSVVGIVKPFHKYAVDKPVSENGSPTKCATPVDISTNSFVNSNSSSFVNSNLMNPCTVNPLVSNQITPQPYSIINPLVSNPATPSQPFSIINPLVSDQVTPNQPFSFINPIGNQITPPMISIIPQSDMMQQCFVSQSNPSLQQLLPMMVGGNLISPNLMSSPLSLPFLPGMPFQVIPSEMSFNQPPLIYIQPLPQQINNLPFSIPLISQPMQSSTNSVSNAFTCVQPSMLSSPSQPIQNFPLGQCSLNIAPMMQGSVVQSVPNVVQPSVAHSVANMVQPVVNNLVQPVNNVVQHVANNVSIMDTGQSTFSAGPLLESTHEVIHSSPLKENPSKQSQVPNESQLVSTNGVAVTNPLSPVTAPAYQSATPTKEIPSLSPLKSPVTQTSQIVSPNSSTTTKSAPFVSSPLKSPVTPPPTKGVGSLSSPLKSPPTCVPPPYSASILTSPRIRAPSTHSPPSKSSMYSPLCVPRVVGTTPPSPKGLPSLTSPLRRIRTIRPFQFKNESTPADLIYCSAAEGETVNDVTPFEAAGGLSRPLATEGSSHSLVIGGPLSRPLVTGGPLSHSLATGGSPSQSLATGGISSQTINAAEEPLSADTIGGRSYNSFGDPKTGKPSEGKSLDSPLLQKEKEEVDKKEDESKPKKRGRKPKEKEEKPVEVYHYSLPRYCDFCLANYESPKCLFYERQTGLIRSGRRKMYCNCCTHSKASEEAAVVPTTNPGWFGKGCRKNMKKKRSF